MIGFDFFLHSENGEKSGRMNIAGVWHSHPGEAMK